MMISLQLNFEEKLDVLTWYHIESAIHCSSSLWFSLVCASLRLKHSILIIEKPLALFPQLNIESRWCTGENWSLLSPRSLGPLVHRFNEPVTNYQEFRDFLVLSK